jgi:hypothetical protein
MVNRRNKANFPFMKIVNYAIVILFLALFPIYGFKAETQSRKFQIATDQKNVNGISLGVNPRGACLKQICRVIFPLNLKS